MANQESKKKRKGCGCCRAISACLSKVLKLDQAKNNKAAHTLVIPTLECSMCLLGVMILLLFSGGFWFYFDAAQNNRFEIAY
jgi:hypothetical protein